MDTTSATSTPLSIKNILESVADARENLIQRLQGIEDNLNKKYGQEITALESDYTRNTKNEEEKYQKDKQKLIEEHPDDKSRLEELEKKHTETLKSLQEKLNKAVHDVKSKAIEEILGVISGIDSRLSKDDLTFSDLGYVLNQIKAELTINSAVKFLSEWHDNIQTLSKGLNGDTGFAAKKYSELKTLLAHSEESAKKVAEGVSNVGESMAEANAQFEEAFNGIINDFAKKIAEENKTDKDLLTAIAIAHGGAEKSLEDLKKKYGDIDAVKNKNVENALKKSIVEMLRTKHKGLDKNEEALEQIADEYIKHAQSRKKLVGAVEGAESGWEKARKVRDKYIAKDTAGGRLLKMLLAGSKATKEGKTFGAGMLGSIKEDVRKDYDSFFYKDATGLLGNGRAYLGAFLESWLLHKRKIKNAEKDFQKNGEEAEQKIRQIAASAEKRQPSIGVGEKLNASDVTTAKIAGHASGKRNIEDGIHVVGEKGAELLVKRGNSISVLQIKPDVSAPASIGVSPIGASQEQSMESSAEFERKQQETEDRHSIAKHTETIVELLREGNEIAKKKETEKKGGGSLLDSLFGLLGMFKPLLKNLLKGLGKLGKFGASLFKKAGSLLGRGARGLGGALKTGGRMGLNALKGAGGLAKGILGKLGPAAMIGMGLYDAYQGWNDEDLHRRAFGLKEGEKASTGQKIQAGMASAGAGILNIGSDIASFFGMDSLAEKIRIDPATLAQAYQTPLKSFGKMITGLTDGVPILGDAVKGLGDFIDSSPMLKGAVDWLDDHNPTKLLTEGIGSAVDWISSDHKWEDVKKGCGNILGTISGGMSDLWKGITGNFSKTNDWLKKKSDVVFNFIKEYNPLALIYKGYEKIKGFVLEKYQKITSWWEENNPFNPIINFFTSIGEFFKSLKLSSMLENVPDIPGRDYLLGWLRDKGLASGAYVRSSSRGTLAVIGEGKEDEAVMPISKLARFALESFDLLEGRMSGFANADTHHGDRNADMLANMRRTLREENKLDIPSILISIDETAKNMQKNIDSICKMMRYIKVDGITLGDMLDHKPSDMRAAQISPGAGYTGAQIGAAVNQMPGGGQSWGAAPALGGPMQALDLPASGAFSGGKAENLNASKQQIANLVIAEAKRQGVDPRLALAIARQESNFNQNDISRAGAVGVMQIMPADVNDYGGGNVYNLNDNIRIGVTEIKKKLQLANGDVREALLRYNWGDGNVRSYKRRGTGNRGQQIPKEAREYADRVLGHIQRGTVANILKASPGGEAAAMQGAQTMNPAPSQSPIPQAQFVPAANGDPYKQTLVPQMNPQQTAQPQGGSRIGNLLNIAARNAKTAYGYSQGQKERMTTHFDCSSFVGRSLREAGFNIPANLTTPQMNPRDKNNVMSNEFTWVPGLNGMQPGDVMWRSGHTELYIGNGQTIGALNGRVSRDKQVGVHPLDWGEFVGYWHPKPKAGESENPPQTMQPAQGQNPLAAQMNPSPAPGSGGDMRQIPQQQQSPVIPHMTDGPIQGLSGLYANLTRDAIGRHVTYGWNSKNSRSGSIDCSGWVTEMNKTALGGLSGQARTNMEAIVRGGQQGGAAGLIQAGESLGFGIDGGQLDPRLGRVKENMMIGLSVGGHAKGRYKNIGHVVQTYRDPTTGELMVSESTSRSRIGGRSGVITTKYSDWYEKYKSAGLHAVDLNAVTGGAFAGGNIRDAMGGVQMPDMGQAAGPSAGPQIQGSQQAQTQQAAQAYYASGGGGNVYAPTTNVMGGGGNADKDGATFLTTKDPMSWIILQGNTVH